MNNYIDKTNMIGLGIVCDNCGRTVQGITYINGMKFCAKCYQETFGKQEDFKTAHYTEHLEQENKKLKQQLAEKENKIKRLTSPCEYFINYNNHIVRKLPLGEEEVLLATKEICDLLNGYAHEFMDSQERYAEWKRHKLSQYNSKKNYVRQVVEKKLRNEICEKIRKELDKYEHITWVLVKNVLDQIEKGE